jgi:acetyl-CoA carboxylase biotin carboxyl carrier protein
MDLKQIQELVKIVNKSGISELSVREGDFGITIKAGGTMQMSQQIHPPVQYAAAPSSENKTESKPENSGEAQAAQAKADNTFTFRSPMIGTFYRKPGPDKDVFVKIGDTIQKGDVLCIIEAMKLFNEIEYDGETGKVVKIMMDESSPVEYDQPLFLIEKV